LADQPEFVVVAEDKTVHISPTDGLPSVGDYPVGTVIESPDGERFRLDVVNPRTQWVPVEAREPEKIDYTRLSFRELMTAVRQGDEDASDELERRMGAAANPSDPAPAPAAADVPQGFEEVPGEPGTFRRVQPASAPAPSGGQH